MRMIDAQGASTTPSQASTLPRLLYMGDVPVEASYHGSVQLYRLMRFYPTNNLWIIEAGSQSSRPAQRLASVSYDIRSLPLARLETTRFAFLYASMCLRAAALRARFFESSVRAWAPDAILTVTHGYSWITAAALSQRLRIPLHLICHDEWARTGRMQSWKEKVFERYYRHAVSRLCVSPAMAEAYEERYGRAGILLYPTRAVEALAPSKPPLLRADTSAPFTCAYAGTINTQGVIEALRQLADQLATHQGRLLIYGPTEPGTAQRAGLRGPNVVFGGLLPTSDFLGTLRAEADVLFVPMSFDAADRSNMEISFPSKLTDYTLVGLPLLIYGPNHSSAVRWARENDGVAEMVTDESGSSLADAVGRLASDPRHRFELARKALAIGNNYFSYERASNVFLRALRAAPHVA